ncbi:glucose 1-dehydrogenase [Nannocystis radixulma]|uniref:Glucose 1-dehydrogenase n=1 Tax=Nannocystis radixulma TaxID=2995305 RepID=A0ABT5BQR4_9BACT|nr:glucose 1-dehydrogenase [Nannocystis radixulma]MDC0675899.1 glucose 1-dehydrogenase [Nannocystis radixulma]
MNALTGKTAIVTGGSRGIGRAAVLRLASDGAAVLLTYRRDEAAARQVVDAVLARGGKASAMAFDLAHATEVERIFDEAEHQFGGVDILVNNAAEVNTPTIADTTEAAWDRAFAVNAKAPFFLIQQAARRMRDDGRIINISTITTALAEPGASLYAGSKAALEQVTRSAAWELAPRRITVNAISPGATDTDLLHAVNPPEALAQAVAMTPLGRLGLPADIADLIAFLASPDARWLTGQNIRATGGLA